VYGRENEIKGWWLKGKLGDRTRKGDQTTGDTAQQHGAGDRFSPQEKREGVQHAVEGDIAQYLKGTKKEESKADESWWKRNGEIPSWGTALATEKMSRRKHLHGDANSGRGITGVKNRERERDILTPRKEPHKGNLEHMLGRNQKKAT